VSWERKLVPSAWNILMLNAKRHVQDKDQSPKKNKIIPRRTILITRARVLLFHN
jgi:hypothetical protein